MRRSRDTPRSSHLPRRSPPCGRRLSPHRHRACSAFAKDVAHRVGSYNSGAIRPYPGHSATEMSERERDGRSPSPPQRSRNSLVGAHPVGDAFRLTATGPVARSRKMSPTGWAPTTAGPSAHIRAIRRQRCPGANAMAEGRARPSDAEGGPVRERVVTRRRPESCRSSSAIPSGRSGAPRYLRCRRRRSPACPAPRTRRSLPYRDLRRPARATP
jgi:hypothetical protein